MSAADLPPLRILHCHSTFAAGGKEVRSVALMNAFGAAAEHTIVSAEPDAMAARALIAPGITARFPANFPSLTGKPTPGRLVTLAEAMKPYDLICTYNWGAMDAAMAHGVFAANLGLPPLIHHEDGFNEDEAERLKPTRNWYRRAALRNAHKLVVPSRLLEEIALKVWQQPPAKVARIPNGIDTAAFAAAPDPAMLRVIKRPGERWVGTLAGLRAVKQLPLLVEAMQALPEDWHLLIAGEGPEREAIRARAAQLELSHRVHLAGAVAEPHKIIGLFDIFALSSRSEQFPLSVVEAMAAGLPVAAPDVGDIRAMVAEENRPYIAVPQDAAALGQMLADLAADEALRARIGAANRLRARAEFSAPAMIAHYRALYWGAAARPI
ncbi:MAG: glycosyltransferase family 4 protein [Erythrobacter sp.]